MTALYRFIENHFGIVLLLSCLAGLFVPGIELLPNETAVFILALLMFLSCYKLQEGGFESMRWRDIVQFYVLRYGLLPVLLWAIARAIVPDYAVGVFLLSVVPAGVSSPAIGSIYGGAVAPGFAIVILSQLAAPFMIPLQFTWLSHFDQGTAAHIMPSPTQLFTTMVWCILVPMLVHALVKKHQSSAAWFTRHNKFLSVLLIAFVIALAIAKQKEVILASGWGLLGILLITILCYTIYMISGWYLAARQAYPARITYAACSVFNNAALGVSLALLHFPPSVLLFVAVSEIGWAMLPMMFRGWLRIVPKT